MRLVETEITISELQSMAESGFGNLVRVVVDVEKKIVDIVNLRVKQ